MNSFEVIGGKKLKGEIVPQGAKNEALQIISAVLLTAQKVTITNIPDILDVNLLIELLGEMNVKIERSVSDMTLLAGYTWSKNMDVKSAPAAVSCDSAGWVGVMNPRDYRRESDKPDLDLLVERLTDYKAVVTMSIDKQYNRNYESLVYPTELQTKDERSTGSRSPAEGSSPPAPTTKR